MDKTTGYCSKTIGCTRKSGFLFAGTRCKRDLGGLTYQIGKTVCGCKQKS